MTVRPGFRSMWWVVAAFALAGCGLKGALTLPSQSEEVVIREASQTAPGTSSEPSAAPEAGTAPAKAGTAPADAVAPATDPASVPAVKKPARRDNRLPPPPLPGGNPGTARGG